MTHQYVTEATARYLQRLEGRELGGNDRENIVYEPVYGGYGDAQESHRSSRELKPSNVRCDLRDNAKLFVEGN